MTDTATPETNDDVAMPEAERQLANFKTTPAAIHNFEGDKMKQWALMAVATGATCGEGEAIVDQFFSLRYFYCHKVTISKMDKPAVEAIRTVLIDPEGNAYGFVSSGVFDSLKTLIQHLGEDFKDWPIPITVRKTETRAGNRFYAIEPPAERQMPDGSPT